jgi:hypothetical protein
VSNWRLGWSDPLGDWLVVLLGAAGCAVSDGVGSGWVVSVGVGCGFGFGSLGILNWAEVVCAMKNTVMQRTRIKRNERLIFASYQLLKDFWADESTLGVPELLV